MKSLAICVALSIVFVQWCSAAKFPYDKHRNMQGGDLESTGCECNSTSCGCCADLVVEKIELNTTACLNLSYLPEQYGISFTLSLGGHVVFNETISARNPPPICFGIPHLEEYFSLCLQFYNMEFTRSSLSGCAKLDATLFKIVVESVDLGCFKIPPEKKDILMKIANSQNKEIKVFQQGFDNYIH